MMYVFIQFPKVELTPIFIIQLLNLSQEIQWNIYIFMHADVCWNGFKYRKTTDICGLQVYVY